MQTALAMHEKRYLSFGNAVFPPALYIRIGERPFHRTQPVAGGLQRIDQPVSRRVFIVIEITLRPVAIRSRIEGIDKHRGDRCRSGNLNAGALEFFGNRLDLPISGVNFRNGWVRGHLSFFMCLAQHFLTFFAQNVDAGCEFVVHRSEILQKIRGE